MATLPARERSYSMRWLYCSRRTFSTTSALPCPAAIPARTWSSGLVGQPTKRSSSTSEVEVVDDPRAFQQPAAFHTTYRLDNSVEFNEAQCWFDGGGAPMAHAPE